MRGVPWPSEEARLEAQREARRRYDRSEKGKAKYARYRQTEGYQQAQERSKPRKVVTSGAARQRLKVEQPEKYQAWLDVAAAVRRGDITKPEACQSCDRVIRLDAHHYRGYAAAHRLDVIWLCRRCHKAAHQGVLAA